ncbi:MAG TPA: antitoxin [Candidatus Dormibacteraeota bacterium]|jgi:hypothetical protein|nr:antitoxin [Candidatus Dormibacteraeota bacterium]
MSNVIRTKSGHILTKADIERIAEEAERGYDPDTLVPRYIGRPSLGETGVSPRVQFRIDAELYRKVRDKAAREHRSLSAVGRKLFEEYVAS